MNEQEFRQRAALAVLPECVSIAKGIPGPVMDAQTGKMVDMCFQQLAANIAAEISRFLIDEFKKDEAEEPEEPGELPAEVHICKLYDADDRFKMIIGCFHKREDAESYASGNPRIRIESLPIA